jgi:hypothetical protein
VERTDPAAVYPTQPEGVSDSHSLVAFRSADCSDRGPIPSQRHLVADGMAKPLDEQTDEELETALAQGQLDERKAAIAKEILSRRWESKSEKIKGRYGWLGHVAAAVALALVAIRRLLRRT